MIFHMNWNPWVSNRLTVDKTFNKVYKVEKKNILVDPEIDFFSYDLPPAWRDKAIKAIKKSNKNLFFIPTKYPGNISKEFMLPNVWIGMKMNKNNQLALLNYDEVMKHNLNRWLYLKNYDEQVYKEELFSCTGKVHTKNGIFWKYAYPCNKCNGTGILNKYKFRWVVLSGGKKGLLREVAEGFRINCENTGIPFYYERSWIHGKLIRDPQLYGRPCAEKPKELFD